MPIRGFLDSQGAARIGSGTQADAEHLRLANILDQMPVGIGIYDSKGRLYHANRHFEDAAGGELSSLSHMEDDAWQPVAPDGTAIEATTYPPARALNGQIATPGMNFIRHLEDGRPHWVAMSAVPLTAPDTPGVVGVVVVAENAESRRLHAEQLRAREERFQRFARHSSNALWIADIASGKLEYLSPAAAKIWKDHDEISTLEEWNGHVHPDDLSQLNRYRLQALTGTDQRFEYRLVDGAGEVMRRVREICFPIPGEDGQDEQFMGGIIEDITPEVQIYVVQQNSGRTDLVEQLRHSARRIKLFSRPEEFINVADVLNAGCVIVDLRDLFPKPGEIVRLLSRRPADLQVILIGSADTAIPDVMAAMRAGAIDYLIEPIEVDALALAVRAAIEALPSPRDALPPVHSDVAMRLTALPRREREVLLGLVAGKTNKLIARALGISPRTVEVHRAHLMERLNVRNLSELLNLAHGAGLKGAL